MLKCTLSKNKFYEVQNIVFNDSKHNYQLTLTEKNPGCESGIFTSKKLELKIVPDAKSSQLHFNKQDGVPELILSNMSLVQHHSSHEKGQTANQNSMPNLSFLYIILAVILLVMLVKYFLKTKNPNNPYNNSNPFNNKPSNVVPLNNDPYNQPNYQPNNQPSYQAPSRTNSFLTGLAGGAVGSIVGNALYDKFRGHDDHPAQNHDSYSSDSFSDDSFSGDDDTFSSDD